MTNFQLVEQDTLDAFHEQVCCCASCLRTVNEDGTFTIDQEFVLSNRKWGGVVEGSAGGTVTWSFATVLNASGRVGFSQTLASFMPEGYEDVIRAAFATWSAVADIQFLEVSSDSANVDIRLGGNAIDGSSGTLGTTFTTFSGTEILEVDIEFDTAESWVAGTSTFGTVGLQEVAIHEIGHAIGLDHETSADAIMAPFIGDITTLTADDIAGAQAIYGAASQVTVGETFTGGSSADSLTGTDGNDTIDGGAGNDTLTGGEGDDVIDGGDGDLDVVSYQFDNTMYTVDNSGGTITVSGPEGTDTLSNVERLTFANGTVRFDTDGNAGEVYRLYQAAFNRTPDTSGLSFWVNNRDNDVALSVIAAEFINSPEFESTYGSNVSNSDFVDLLYQNVLGRAGENSGVTFWVNSLEAGAPRKDVLIGFSDSTENILGVADAIEDGIFVTS